MAGKKDFSEMNLGRVFGTIEQATADHRGQSVITPEEKAKRESTLKTQGRKGAKLPRINLAFSPQNFDFVRVVARASGKSMTEFINLIIAQYRTEHPDLYDKAKALAEEL